MKKSTIVLLVLAVMMTAGTAIRVQAQETKMYENAKVLVADVKTRITEISLEDLKKKMDAQEDFVLIDVRDKGEFIKGSIPSALNISRGLLEFKIGDKVEDKSKEIVLFCKSGSRSALATAALKSIGYTNVKSLAGGWVAWDKAAQE